MSQCGDTGLGRTKKRALLPASLPAPPFYLCQVWDLNPHYKFAANFSLTKNYLVRCGVRTHALSREPELKSGALDLSANLTLARNSEKRLVKKKVVGCRGCDNQPLFHC